MKSTILNVAALMALTAEAALIGREAASSAAGPVTIKDKQSAIASVMAVMSAMKPKDAVAAVSSSVTADAPKAAAMTSVPTSSITPKATTKAAAPASTLSDVGVKTITETAFSKMTIAPPAKSKTTPAAKPKITSAGKPKTTKKGKAAKTTPKPKAKTTKAAKLQNRDVALTIGAYGACGYGIPVYTTYDCINGWACQSMNAFYYQCVAATSSSARTSSTTTTTTTTTSATSLIRVTTSIPVATPVITTSIVPTTTAVAVAATSALAGNVIMSVLPMVGSSLALPSVLPQTTSRQIVNVQQSVATGAVAQVTSLAVNAGNIASTTLSTATQTQTLGVNDPCGPQPNYGYTYVPQALGPQGFMADAIFNAVPYVSVAPLGYTWAYAGFFASLSQDGYMGMMQLASYTPSLCSAACDATAGCKGFSVYYERTPVLNPASSCANPNPQTVIKCAMYSQAVDWTKATNVGEWRSNFAVVITGANGYNKN